MMHGRHLSQFDLHVICIAKHLRVPFLPFGPIFGFRVRFDLFNSPPLWLNSLQPALMKLRNVLGFVCRVGFSLSTPRITTDPRPQGAAMASGEFALRRRLHSPTPCSPAPRRPRRAPEKGSPPGRAAACRDRSSGRPARRAPHDCPAPRPSPARPPGSDRRAG